MDAFWLSSILRYDAINKGGEAQNGEDVLDVHRDSDSTDSPTRRSDVGSLLYLEDVGKALKTERDHPRERFVSRTPRYIEIGNSVFSAEDRTRSEDFHIKSEWQLRVEGLGALIDWVHATENAVSSLPNFKIYEKGEVDRRDHIGVEFHIDREVATKIQKLAVSLGMNEETASIFADKIATVQYFPNEDNSAEVVDAAALLDWSARCHAKFTELIALRRDSVRENRIRRIEDMCQKGWISREKAMDEKRRLRLTIPIVDQEFESPLATFVERTLRHLNTELESEVRPTENLFSQIASRRLTVRSPAGGLAFVSRLPGIENRIKEVAQLVMSVEDIDLEYADSLNERAVDSYGFIIFETARLLALGGCVTFQLVDAIKNLIEVYGSSLTFTFDGVEMSVRSGREVRRLRIGERVPKIEGLSVGVTLDAPILQSIRGFFQAARMDAEASCLDPAVLRIFNFLASSRMRVREGERIAERKIFIRVDAALVTGIVTHEIRIRTKVKGLELLKKHVDFQLMYDKFFSEFLWVQRAGSSWRTAFENFGAMALPRRFFYRTPEMEQIFLAYANWRGDPGITPGVFYRELKSYVRHEGGLYRKIYAEMPVPKLEKVDFYVVPSREPSRMRDGAQNTFFLSNIIYEPLDLEELVYQGEDERLFEERALSALVRGGFRLRILDHRPMRRIDFSGEPCKGTGATPTEALLGINAFPWISTSAYAVHEPKIPLGIFLSRSVKVLCYIPETQRGLHTLASDYGRFLIIEDRLDVVT